MTCQCTRGVDSKEVYNVHVICMREGMRYICMILEIQNNLHIKQKYSTHRIGIQCTAIRGIHVYQEIFNTQIH